MSSADGLEDRKRLLPAPAWWIVGALVLATLLMRVPYLNVPLERDEGEYAYTAWRIQQGEVPYRDVFCQKPPGVFVVYWLTQKTLGGDPKHYHVMGTLFVMVEMVLLYWVVSGFVRRWVALTSVLVCAWLATGMVMLGSSANTETFGSVFIVLTALLTLQGRRAGQWWWFFAGGLAAGMGSLFKQPILLFGLVPMVGGLLRRGQTGRREWSIGRGSVALTGLLLPWAAVFGYFAWRGALHEMLYAVWLHNFAYSVSLPMFAVMQRVAARWSVMWRMAGVLLGLGIWGMVRRMWRSEGMVLGVWTVVSAAAVIVGFQFIHHYFLMAVPVLGLLMAMGAQDCWQLLTRGCGRLSGLLFLPDGHGDSGERGSPGPWCKGTAAAVIVAAMALPPVIIELPFLARAATSMANLSRKRYTHYIFAMSPEIGARIAAITRPDETIFIFGSEPQIPYYARRRSASRHIIFDPVFGPYRRAVEFQEEIIDDLRREEPAVIVQVAVTSSQMIRETSDRRLASYVNEVIGRKYIPVGMAFARTGEQQGIVTYWGTRAIAGREDDLRKEAEGLLSQGRSVEEAQAFVQGQQPEILVMLRTDLLDRQVDWGVGRSQR